MQGETEIANRPQASTIAQLDRFIVIEKELSAKRNIYRCIVKYFINWIFNLKIW